MRAPSDLAAALGVHRLVRMVCARAWAKRQGAVAGKVQHSDEARGPCRSCTGKAGSAALQTPSQEQQVLAARKWTSCMKSIGIWYNVTDGSVGLGWCAVFTNRLEDMRLQDLAEMDVKFLVHEVGHETP